MNDFQNFSGYTLNHRFLWLLVELDILTQRQHSLYQWLIQEADWRKSNSTYGTVYGTREQIRERMRCKVSQNTFNLDFKRLLELRLVQSDRVRRWRISNFQIHLNFNSWQERLQALGKHSIPHFQEYLKENLQNQEKVITETVLNDVKQTLLLFLATEEKFIELADANKGNKENKNPMSGKVQEGVEDIAPTS